MFSDVLFEREDGYVGIYSEHLRCIPFGKLQSRHVAAVMLSFFGSNEEVYEILRKASHKTRAYITNANGLKGFLVPFSVLGVLRTISEAYRSTFIRPRFKSKRHYMAHRRGPRFLDPI